MFAVLIAALAHDVPEQDASLRSVEAYSAPAVNQLKSGAVASTRAERSWESGIMVVPFHLHIRLNRA